MVELTAAVKEIYWVGVMVLLLVAMKAVWKDFWSVATTVALKAFSSVAYSGVRKVEKLVIVLVEQMEFESVVLKVENSVLMTVEWWEPLLVELMAELTENLKVGMKVVESVAVTVAVKVDDSVEKRVYG